MCTCAAINPTCAIVKQNFFPTAVDELADNYTRVTEHLTQRHVATYISSNTNRDGKWRNVEIVTGDHLRVRSRAGYQAPDNQ